MYRLKLMQAMFLLAYHAFLRVGEITESEHNLLLSDVTLTTISIKLLFRSCKHALGVSQEATVSAMTGELYCPVMHCPSICHTEVRTGAAIFMEGKASFS